MLQLQLSKEGAQDTERLLNVARKLIDELTFCAAVESDDTSSGSQVGKGKVALSFFPKGSTINTEITLRKVGALIDVKYGERT
jgi:hypothetical protein